ncbi:MAG: CotH kinase family protein [Clostridia bacterium]|nr:CotH kinase family protein [Clostridia bacterium]
MRKTVFIITAALLLLGASSAYAAVAQPVPSIAGGVYETEQTVSFSCAEGCTIYYTTDGSVPNASSQRYTEPITVTEQWETPSSATTSMEQSPKGTVIRAIAVNQNGEMSTVANNTYIVAAEIFDLYQLPILALTVSDYDMWDSTYGIWSNYYYDHKVNAYVEYFEPDGTLGFKRGITTKVSGQWSKAYLKKSLRLYFNDNNYENPLAKKYLTYDLYDDSYQNIESRDLVNRFGKLTLRISDFEYSNLRDPMAQKLAKRLNVDTASSRPVALFITGEFFGIYELREQFDDRYEQFHYKSIDKDEVVSFSRESRANRRLDESPLPDSDKVYIAKNEYQEGPENNNQDSLLGENYYRKLVNHILALIIERDITSEAVYSEVSNYIDIDSYIDWIAMYVYAASDDWSGNNARFWRTTEEGSDGLTFGADGKFRFIIHDLDLSFSSSGHDTLYSSMISTSSDTRRTPLSRETLKSIFKNDEFRSEFAQRMMIYLSTAFSNEVVYNDADTLINRVSYSKERDLKRWRLLSGSLSSWESEVSQLLTWATRRNSSVISIIRNHYNNYLGQSVPSSMTNVTFSTDTSHGYIRVAGADISPALYEGYTYPTSFSASMYRGIPITVEGVCDAGYKSVCTLTYGRSSTTVTGRPLTFTIPADSTDTYTVTVEFVEGENDSDTFSGETMLMRDYEFENLTEPAALDVMGRFEISGWQKLFGTVITVKEGCREDVVAVNGRVISPMRRGTTTLCVEYEGNVYEFDVTVPASDRLISPKEYVTVSAADEKNFYHVAQNAADGIKSSRWESTSSETWIMAELYATREITEVDVMYQNTSTCDCVLQYSLDGVDWTDAEYVSETTMEYDDRTVSAKYADQFYGTQTYAKVVTYDVNAFAKYLRVYYASRLSANASVNEIWAYTKPDCAVVLQGVNITQTAAGVRVAATVYSAQNNSNTRLVAAVFDSLGQIIGAKTLSSALSEGNMVYTFDIAADGFSPSNCEVKIFVWDTSGVVPILE